MPPTTARERPKVTHFAKLFVVSMAISTSLSVDAVASTGGPDFQRCADLVSGPRFEADRLRHRSTERLKEAVFRVADCARAQVTFDDEDNSPIIAEALNPLVDELGRRQRDVGLLEKVARSTGVWQNVWNDLPTIKAFADSIYQVVTPKGFYYNISKFPVRGDASVVATGLLRGRYEPNDNGEIDIFFMKNVTAPGFPRPGTPLAPLAELAETGLLDPQSARLTGSEPFERELASGQLETVYIDESFRIIRGDHVGPIPAVTLFVLVRQPTVSSRIRLAEGDGD